MSNATPGSSPAPKHLGGVTGKGFMPGQSGNPKGRPKKRTLEEDLRAILGEELPKTSMNKQQLIARIWVDEIIQHRNLRALTALLDRLYPAPRRVDPNAVQIHMPTVKIIELPGGEEFLKAPEERPET